jgi:hypothetical protein
MGFEIAELSGAFQAEEEGSIPFTRSNFSRNLSVLVSAVWDHVLAARVLR